MHFVCVGHPAEARRVRRRPALRRGAPPSRCSSVLAPGDLVVGKSTVPVGTAARLAELVAGKVPGALLAWNPEFLREGFAVAGHPAPRPAGLRRCPPAPTARPRAALLDEVYAPIVGARHPAGGHRLRHRGDGEDGGQLVPGHQDLLHQRDGRAVRGHRRRRQAAGRRDRLRRPDRPQVPQRRPRLRRRLPAQGHPRVHGPRRRAGRRPGADLPARGRQHQHAPPDPHGRAGPRGLRRLAARQAGRRPRRGVQARQRRHPRLPGARTSPRSCSCRAPSSGSPTRRRSRTAAGCGRSSTTPTPPRRRPSAPTPSWCSPSGSSTASSTRSPSASVVAQKRVLDGRNALDRDAWTAAGWTYRALGRRAG